MTKNQETGLPPMLYRMRQSGFCYLIRDGQMKGDHVYIFEKEPIPGGACDGWQ